MACNKVKLFSCDGCMSHAGIRGGGRDGREGVPFGFHFTRSDHSETPSPTKNDPTRFDHSKTPSPTKNDPAYFTRSDHSKTPSPTKNDPAH